MRTVKTATAEDVAAVDSAIAHIKEARDLLVKAGATQAADKVRAALISAEGAQRHVRRRFARSEATRTPDTHS